MSDRLTLNVDPNANSDREMSRVHVYTSSLTDAAGNPFLSLSTRGPGMRLTLTQAGELHDWLGRWLAR